MISITNLTKELIIYTIQNNITIEGIPSNSKIILFDLSGKQIRTNNAISSNIFRIENIASGSYIIHIIVNGNYNLIKKIILP